MTDQGPGSWPPAQDGSVPPPPGAGATLLPPPPAPQAPMPWAPPPSANPLGIPGTPGIEYGSVLSRFVAYWLDGLLVEIVGLIIAFAIGLAIGSTGRFGLAGLIAGIVFLGIHLLYFVGFWTGHARATLAMRLMKLSIGNAVDGTTLTVQQGLVRWLAIGGIFQVLSIVPGLSLLTIVAPFWTLGLLISTMASPTRQGLHDRAASSAIVQPVGASSPALACLVIVAILVGIGILSVVALIFLGGQVSNILSSVGSSI